MADIRSHACLNLLCIGVGLSLTFGLVFIEPADAQTNSHVATLSGADEVPVVSTEATGHFTGILSDQSLAYTLTSDASDITQAHIHLGIAGEDGPIAAVLFDGQGGVVDGLDISLDISGTVTPADLIEVDWDSFVEALDSGAAYVNVRTASHPAGEIRGQIATVVAQEPTTSEEVSPEPPGEPAEIPTDTVISEPAAETSDEGLSATTGLIVAVAATAIAAGTVGAWASWRHRRVARGRGHEPDRGDGDDPSSQDR